MTNRAWTNYYHDMWIVHHNAVLTMKAALEKLEREKDKVDAAFRTRGKDPKAEKKVKRCIRKRA